MADEKIKPSYLYRQVASRLADAIGRGDYPPGSVMPSETEIMERYGVSRPTARAAVAELRHMGLVESQQGKGSFVRQQAVQAVTVEQSITRRGKRFFPCDDEFTEIESANISRTHTAGAEAELLGREDEAAFAVDRMLTNPATGLRASHRAVIPFAIAEQHPALAEKPDTEPAEIYALLTAAGHTLTWRDYISARPATPDDRNALRASDSTWLLVCHRVTQAKDGSPLMLETLTSSAERTQLAYRVTADRAPATLKPV